MDPGRFLGFKPVANQFQTRSSNRDRTEKMALWVPSKKESSEYLRPDIESDYIQEICLVDTANTTIQ